MENADLTCTYIIWLIFDGAKCSSAPTGDLVGGRQDPSRPMLMSSKLCISRDVPRHGYRCRWGIAPASPRVFLHDFAYLDIHPWHSSGPNQPPDMIWGGGVNCRVAKWFSNSLSCDWNNVSIFCSNMAVLTSCWLQDEKQGNRIGNIPNNYY